MDASLEWCSTPPLWHTKAVGGRPPGQSHMARREGYASLAPSARSRFPPQKLCQYFPDGIILRWNYSSAIALPDCAIRIDLSRMKRLCGDPLGEGDSEAEFAELSGQASGGCRKVLAFTAR